MPTDQVVDTYRRYYQGILSGAHIVRVKDIVLIIANEPEPEKLYNVGTLIRRNCN